MCAHKGGLNVSREPSGIQCHPRIPLNNSDISQMICNIVIVVTSSHLEILRCPKLQNTSISYMVCETYKESYNIL